MRVLVCGSRTWRDRGRIEGALTGLVAKCADRGEDLAIIEGGARGADRFACDWARRVGKRWAKGACVEIYSDAFPADWDKHGKAAGTIRNQLMLDVGQPDLVLAFVDKPLAESRGTADMVRRAQAAGVPVEVDDGRGTRTKISGGTRA